jgi:hypothetical protein
LSDPAGTAKPIDGTGSFTIDNAVAKALRDDDHRLGELSCKKCGGPLSAMEVEEESKLRISCGTLGTYFLSSDELRAFPPSQSRFPQRS